MAEDIWKGLQEGIIRAFSEKAKVVRVTPHEHLAFHRSFSHLAEKYNLGYVPEVIVADKFPIGPVWTHKLPGGGAHPHRVVILNKSMMELTGSDVTRAMSPSLETVMAHEFSHLKMAHCT